MRALVLLLAAVVSAASASSEPQPSGRAAQLAVVSPFGAHTRVLIARTWLEGELLAAGPQGLYLGQRKGSVLRVLRIPRPIVSSVEVHAFLAPGDDGIVSDWRHLRPWTRYPQGLPGVFLPHVEELPDDLGATPPVEASATQTACGQAFAEEVARVSPEVRRHYRRARSAAEARDVAEMEQYLDRIQQRNPGFLRAIRRCDPAIRGYYD